MSSTSPKPADLRMILARNLHSLTAQSGNISELCRKIGVNRTQFNRYLAGTAFPRPDVLYRICTHFEVDANILLRPLEEMAPTDMAKRAEQASLLPGQPSRPFDHYLLPDGLYGYWRKSFRQPRRAYLGIALITTEGAEKHWKGYDLHDHPIRPGGQRFARSSRYDGLLIQQFDGFALVSRTPYSDVMNFTYFEYGLDGLLDYYSGLSFVARRRLPEASRLSGIIMQRLPATCSATLAWARRCGSQDIDSLPPLIQKALARVPDQI